MIKRYDVWPSSLGTVESTEDKHGEWCSYSEVVQMLESLAWLASVSAHGSSVQSEILDGLELMRLRSLK